MKMHHQPQAPLTHEAFLEALDQEKHALYRFALRTLQSATAVEDTLANAVLRAHGDRASYTPGTDFRIWMYRFLHEACTEIPVTADTEVDHAFSRLSLAERTGIMLRLVERLSYDEIGEVLELPLHRVIALLRGARRKLHTELAPYTGSTRLASVG
jgi:DNA-directed RNA polymerase specialized sigma24 family protein